MTRSRRRAGGARSGTGHGSALPVFQAGRSPPGQRPRKSMPRPPSQNVCTTGSGQMTSIAPPRMPMKPNSRVSRPARIA